MNQAKLRSYHTSPKYKYGFQVPKNYDEAIKLDNKFGNNKWKEATNIEMGSMEDYEVFDNAGHTPKVCISKDIRKFKHILYSTSSTMVGIKLKW